MDSFLANLELLTLMLTGPHPDLVILVLTCGFYDLDTLFHT